MPPNDAIGSEESIRLTEAARMKIRETMSARGPERRAVRIYGQPTRCAGPEIGMAFDRPGPSDLAIEAGDLIVIVDLESAPVLGKILIDYTESGGRRGFIISRQPAGPSCGCAT